MIEWGISSGSHDAALSIVKGNELIFASQSERFSGIKNDKELCDALIEYGLNFGHPDNLYFYENILLKKSRYLFSKQYNLLLKNNKKNVLKKLKWHGINNNIKSTDHHISHAAGGYYTSQFDEAAVLVIDAIGEWDTTSIWCGNNNSLTKKWNTVYPNSLGLWYSAMTQRIGLKPNEEEYILMGMACLGDPNKYYDDIKKTFFHNCKNLFKLKRNLHKGCLDWHPNENLYYNYDVAAATQKIFEEEIIKLVYYTKKISNSNYLILSGGCALNCVANTKIANLGLFRDIWIMPNPGDAGSSLGCILANKNKHINWKGALLGYDMGGQYPLYRVFKELINNKIVGVVAGRAEFGPRALGNRSILADPRGDNIKDLVNSIKRREEFRPFSPAILEEHVHDYFEMPTTVNSSPYMQYVAKCKYPDKFPAIVHYDNSSRVQTVNKQEFPDFYKLLKLWYEETGCPMLLNTSLNVKGYPLVNDFHDAYVFSKYNQNIKIVY